ncbi:MAG: N-acetyl-gamma-glutamyl-phosphate reductase [Pyrinomonadaceae bacterium]
MQKIRAAIIGGSGYGGSELLRILLFHPAAEVAFVTANEQAGRNVSDVHRNLLGLTDLVFEKMPESNSALDGIDIAFFALPHGQAMTLIPKLCDRAKAIDLSGDFRINDAAEFSRFYNLEHSEMAVQKEFVYGLTEINREKIAASRFVANPGCFATATLLALIPLVSSGLVTGSIVADVKTGSSGSGVKAAANTHHPQRSNSFYVYKPFVHQHIPEIRQQLNESSDFNGDLVFMTHSLPVSRGIFASCYAQTTVNLANEDLRSLYHKFYGDAFFVRMVEGSPDINWVKNTNFCDVGVSSDGKHVAVFSALDNLVKGAAGQAIQNMNIMFGLDEKTGLIFAGSNP